MKVESMREKIGPWLPAIFCAVLAGITTIGNLWIYAVTDTQGALTLVYILNMPMCFFFVGAYLAQLRNENRELRSRLNVLDGANTDS